MATKKAQKTGHTENLEEALSIVRRHSGYNAIAGLVPVPALDVIVITGIQIRMLGELSALYGVAFAENSVKSYVAALVGGVIPVSGLSVGLFSAVKAIPLVGTLLGITVVPGVAATCTWAVGRVFTAHFERGGTLLDFDVESARESFQSEFKKVGGKVSP